MRKILLLSIVFCNLNIGAQSEKALERNRKMFEAMKTKPLCVVIDSEDEKFEAKLLKKNKVEELANYKRAISQFNTYIKSAVEDFLDVFPAIRYITHEEYKSMSNKELKSVNILLRTFPPREGMGYGNANSGFNGGNAYGSYSFENTLETVKLDTNNVDESSVIQFKSWIDDEMFPLLSQRLNKLFCTKNEVYFAVRQFKNTFDHSGDTKEQSLKEYRDGVEALKSKTLIINENDLPPGLTEMVIKEVYVNAFKIVSQVEYESYFFAKNDKVLVLVVIPMIIALLDTPCIFDPALNTFTRADVRKCEGPLKKSHFEWLSKPL